MARLLTDADLSRVAAKVIPCGDSTIRRRFAIEYLDIDHNEFKKIAYNQRDNCEEIVYECLQKWTEKRKEKGEDTTVQALVEVFEEVLKENEGWFTKVSYQFLFQEQKTNSGKKHFIGTKRHRDVLPKHNKKYARLMAEINELQREKERLEEDRARVQEKLRMKEELARAPFWNDGHMLLNRCRSLVPNNCPENFEIRKSRSF